MSKLDLWHPSDLRYPGRGLSGPCLPLLTVNSEYGLVELWDFPLDHGPEAVPQLVVVLLELLLVLPLLRRDEPPVLLYSLTASEVERGGCMSLLSVLSDLEDSSSMAAS